MLLIILVAVNSCYKTKEDPDYLRNEYLTAADFQYYYNNDYSFEDSVYAKVKGYVDKESFSDFLYALDTLKNDTNNPVKRIEFKIVDYTSGFDVNICINTSRQHLPLSDLYYFFESHKNDNYLYAKGILETFPMCCNLFPNAYPTYLGKAVNIIDTTDLRFESK